MNELFIRVMSVMFLAATGLNGFSQESLVTNSKLSQVEGLTPSVGSHPSVESVSSAKSVPSKDYFVSARSFCSAENNPSAESIPSKQINKDVSGNRKSATPRQYSNKRHKNFEAPAKKAAQADTDRDTLWVVDSVYHYDGNGNEWKLNTRKKVLHRNRAGNQTDAIVHFWVDSLNKWEKKDTIYGTFYDKNSMAEKIGKHWNTNEQKWEDSTGFFTKYNETGKTQETFKKYRNYNDDEYSMGNRVIHQYDEEGNQQKEVYQIRDLTSKEWVDYWQTHYTYHSNGKLTRRLTEKWNGDLGKWVREKQKLFDYTGEGKIKEVVKQEWNGTSDEWVNTDRRLHSYNADGNKSEYLRQNWNDSISTWRDTLRHQYFYDAENNKTKELRQAWDPNAETWKDTLRYVYSYNADGDLTNGKVERWQSNTNEWMNKDTVVVNYHGTGSREEYIRKPWAPQTKSWGDTVEYRKYDDDGHQLQFLDAAWDNDSSKLVYGYRWHHRYNANGKKTREVKKYWDAGKEQWLNDARSVYHWDAFVPEYIISLSVSPNGRGSVRGGGTYPDGEQITMEAIPDSGYVFGAWISRGDTISKESACNITVARDSSLTAHFIPSHQVSLFSLPSEGGSVSGSGVYPHGETTTIEAAPSDEYVFDAWIYDDQVIDTVSSLTMKIDQDTSLTARFVPGYDLSLSANPSGGGEVDGDGCYPEGERVDIEAISDDGYAFEAWLSHGDTVTTDSAYSFILTRDSRLTAHFAPKHRLILSANPTTGGSVSGDGYYMEGRKITITARPHKSYRFDKWKEGDMEISTDSVYTFSLEEDRNLVAVFSEVATSLDGIGKTDIYFYPNPVDDVIHISGPDASDYSITIYDIRGLKVMEKRYNRENASIRVEKLKRGMYFLKLQTHEGKKHTERFIKN